MNKIFLQLFFFTSSWSVAFSQADCKLRKDQGGIKVYTCSTDTSEFKSIKVECSLNCSLEKLESFLLDFDNYVHWQYNTTESKALKKIADSEFIYYVKIEAPWPVADRDIAIHLRAMRSVHELLISANSESGFLPEKENFVRIPSLGSRWAVTEKNKNELEIKYSIQIDPGGNVPAWVVNWVCANAPLQSFQALKKQLEKK
ncbi:MAG: IS3 family transposase [Bacteroidetes bacterium]|nr:IS3 family transposase [Bacteroidota bacterium]MBI3483078.1 IS3 family transposase [Bacteroidota bacterium]